MAKKELKEQLKSYEGYINDMEKLNTAASMGWLVLRFTTEDRLKNATLSLIKETIRLRKTYETK